MSGKSELSLFNLGTSGWSYKHWTGVFYPEKTKPIKFLEYYLTQFDCVELNSSFYYPPKKTTIDGWVMRTPETFTFCPKMSRYITHLRGIANAEESLAKFFRVFNGMKDRLGPVLIQLPPELKYDASLITDFMDILRDKYSHLKYAIEVRHKSWIRDEFYSLLEEYGIAFVIADSGKRFPYYEAMTADFVYIRFHGREKLYAFDYPEWELKEYAAKIDSWLKKGKEVWAFFNNDFEGYAVKNAQKLREIIDLMQ
jgi:uncharacterized protein YecE (DUF72 family)